MGLFVLEPQEVEAFLYNLLVKIAEALLSRRSLQFFRNSKTTFPECKTIGLPSGGSFATNVVEMRSCRSYIVLGFVLYSCSTIAQGVSDTSKHELMSGYLNEVIVSGSKSAPLFLPKVAGTNIYAAKKTHLVTPDQLSANLATNNMREILAKVPGIQVWESDASGIQVGIAARGLSPNRSWEFNIRQNGYDISADPYGYPEAYFTPPMQAVQQIQVVRGAGALQYGPQFGGMVNYLLRDGNNIPNKLQVEGKLTLGSYGLFNAFCAVGGSTAKVHYYAYYNRRNGAGWRDNSQYNTDNVFGTVNVKVTDKLNIGAEIMGYNMLSQQAGGLTDAQFAQNAKASNKARNYISTPWWTAALNAHYQFGEGRELNIKAFGVLGDRNSVGMLTPANVPDTINTQTNQYNNRELQADKYRNAGLEARYIIPYRAFGTTSHLSAGIKAYTGTTTRNQKGKGSTGDDYSMVAIGEYLNKLSFQTNNGSVYAEHLLNLGRKLGLTQGIRYEYISMAVSGRLGFKPDSTENTINAERRTRSVLLGSVGAEYQLGAHKAIYANVTQAYRPMLFSDLTATPTTDVIDPNLKDATGYNADLGIRGSFADLITFDAGIYYLVYNNRIALVSRQRPDNTFYNYRTNIGSSTSKGLELLAELPSLKKLVHRLPFDADVFVSYGYTDARYGDYLLTTKDANNKLKTTNLKDNKIENAPEHILRTGVTLRYHSYSLSAQVSEVSKAFSNANNTQAPTADGTNGIIPAYTVADIGAAYRATQNLMIKAGINNVANRNYFTRRATGYPGPGLLPADGRNAYVSIEWKL